MSISLSLLLFDIISPITVPFLSNIVLGFIAHYLSVKAIAKTIGIASLTYGLVGGMKYGLFGAWFYLSSYFIGAIILIPISYFTFKKYHVKERLGR